MQWGFLAVCRFRGGIPMWACILWCVHLFVCPRVFMSVRPLVFTPDIKTDGQTLAPRAGAGWCRGAGRDALGGAYTSGYSVGASAFAFGAFYWSASVMRNTIWEHTDACWRTGKKESVRASNMTYEWCSECLESCTHEAYEWFRFAIAYLMKKSLKIAYFFQSSLSHSIWTGYFFGSARVVGCLGKTIINNF